MTSIIIVVFFALLAWAAWWWLVSKNRPDIPPLAIDNNDPLMIEARIKASESIPQLRELFNDAKEFARVKVPFVSNSGETEHLWAELLSIDDNTIHVRYMTPPVSHSGKLERLHFHPVTDIEDWVFTKDPNKYVGGYSMRVMFKRGKELWGELPPELQREEKKYG